MTQSEFGKRMAELEAEADRNGCAVIPAEPLFDPADQEKG